MEKKNKDQAEAETKKETGHKERTLPGGRLWNKCFAENFVLYWIQKTEREKLTVLDVYYINLLCIAHI